MRPTIHPVGGVVPATAPHSGQLSPEQYLESMSYQVPEIDFVPGAEAAAAAWLVRPAAAEPLPAFAEVDQPPPFQNNPFVLQLTGMREVRLGKERYATARNFAQAIRTGQLLYGATSWVVLEGTGSAKGEFCIIPTAEPLRKEHGYYRKFDVDGETYWVPTRIAVWRAISFTHDQTRASYQFRCVVTADNRLIIRDDIDLIRQYRRDMTIQVKVSDLVPEAFVRDHVVRRVREIRTAEGDQAAALRIGMMNEKAFRLLTPSERFEFLTIVMAAGAGTWQYIKDLVTGDDVKAKAILALLASVGSTFELELFLDTIKEQELIRDLFWAMDATAFQCLIFLGKTLAPDEDLSREDLLAFIKAGIGISWSHLNPLDDTIADSLVKFLIREGRGQLEGMMHLIEFPEQLPQGLGQLGTAIRTLWAGLRGDEQAQAKIDETLSHLGTEALACWRGARLLGVPDLVLLRAGWVILWNVINLLWSGYDLGMDVAAVTGALARFAGRAARWGYRLTAARLPILARLLRLMEGSPLAGTRAAEEVLEALAHLPEPVSRRFAEAMAGVANPEQLSGIESLEQLAAISPELKSAAEAAVRESQALRELADATGGQLADVAEVYALLREVYPL